MISVLILTKDEEVNLPRCLESVSWSDDIVILDDGSTDKTIEIAIQHGAKVIRHSAGGERAQRSFSIREINFKYPWVYNPDADEITPVELRDEMLRVVSESDNRHEVAYRVRFKNMFMGEWIKHSSIYPTWVIRLFRPDKVSFKREINLNYEINGTEGKLQEHFEHYSFNKGFSAWFAKHNRYSDLEAVEAATEIESGIIDWKGLICFLDHPRRRKSLKNLALRMPYRTFIIFIYLYVIRGGFLDGRSGFEYCILRCIYEYMIDMKVKELRRRESGLAI